jgi:F0F1-type ATP synthase assembly protein I
VSGIFIYISGTTNTKLHEVLDNKTFGTANATQVINDSMGMVDETYKALYWISVFLIVGMMLSIFVGSYMVTTKPIFFVPYIMIVIIAVVVSVVMSIAYGQIITDPAMSGVYDDFVGANFIMSYLPLWVSVIGIVGGVIMFSRMGTGQTYNAGGYYG